jgi:hypothetical protein
MGVFLKKKSDGTLQSPFWYYYNEKTQQKVKTEILVGAPGDQRKDSRKLADDVYHKEMNAIGARIHKIATARGALRFSVYAVEYKPIIKARRGATRELEILAQLVAFFGTRSGGGKNQPNDDLLTHIDKARVTEYFHWRKATTKPTAQTINREIDVLKAMLRDAAPKYIEASPIIGMKRFKGDAVRRTRLASKSEETRVLNTAKRLDPVFYALYVLALDTLTRMGDLLDVKRSDRHDKIWIYLGLTKNGTPNDVPLSKRAAAALDAIEKLLPADQPRTKQYYFAKFRRAANPRDWRGAVRQRFEIICREAKVDFGVAEGGVSFHWATRTTSATRKVVKERLPIRAVQKLGGWTKPDVLIGIYNQVDQGDLLAAVGQSRRRAAR